MKDYFFILFKYISFFYQKVEETVVYTYLAFCYTKAAWVMKAQLQDLRDALPYTAMVCGASVLGTQGMLTLLWAHLYLECCVRHKQTLSQLYLCHFLPDVGYDAHFCSLSTKREQRRKGQPFCCSSCSSVWMGIFLKMTSKTLCGHQSF